MDGLAVGSCFQTCKGRTNIIRLLDYEFAGKERLELIASGGAKTTPARCSRAAVIAALVSSWVQREAALVYIAIPNCCG